MNIKTRSHCTASRKCPLLKGTPVLSGTAVGLLATSRRRVYARPAMTNHDPRAGVGRILLHTTTSWRPVWSWITCVATTVPRGSWDGPAWDRVPPCMFWYRVSYSIESSGFGHRQTSRKRSCIFSFPGSYLPSDRFAADQRTVTDICSLPTAVNHPTALQHAYPT